jgi:hypothetical protein
MGYYIRTLTQTDQRVPFSELRAALAKNHPTARLLLREGTETQWKQLLLTHSNATPIALVERNSVSEAAGAEELQEFRHEIADCVPRAAATWLDHYLSRVRTIHAFQVLAGTKLEKGWDILGSLKTALWQKTGGIIQADREGFTNEDGYHILWQFPDQVSGSWWMGVLEAGLWVHFQMDLGNPTHREAFMAGAIPPGVKRISARN